MESNSGMNSGPSGVAQSSYHVVHRNDNNNSSMVPSGASPLGPSQVNAGIVGEKKKRGRPRKYGPDGAVVARAVPQSSFSAPPGSGGSFLVEKMSASRPASEKKHKKTGAENLGDWVSCASGGHFLPHVITVESGQDVTMKIIAFSQQGPRAICIISASGLISNVTLRQPNSSGGTLTYEGRFEILSLSGSFAPPEFGGSKTSRTGGMSISLSSPDGRVIGGMLAGLLIAASPVQVVVGSFLPSNYNEIKTPKKPKSGTKRVPNPEVSIAFNNSDSRNPSGLGMVYPGSATQNVVLPSNWRAMQPVDSSKKPATDINIPLQE